MRGRLLPRAELGPKLRGAMLALLERHFEGVTEQGFAADLEEKDWVVLVEDAAGALCGFSTLAVYTSEAAGARVGCSGDTIVEGAARGSTALGRTWLEAVGELGPSWWLLITSGFRTYRFLPVFWREFWPRHDASSRPPLLDALARERFGERYDPAAGVVRLASPQRLRGCAGEEHAARFADPHVAFFHRANPGHAAGDELVCLCPLGASNQTPAGLRLHPL